MDILLFPSALAPVLDALLPTLVVNEEFHLATGETFQRLDLVYWCDPNRGESEPHFARPPALGHQQQLSWVALHADTTDPAPIFEQRPIRIEPNTFRSRSNQNMIFNGWMALPLFLPCSP